MSARKLIVVLGILAVLLAPSTVLARGKPTAASTDGPTCSLPQSNADGLEILANYYPGYWWDHTDLTIAVQAPPGVSAAHLAAVHDAIATWSEVLLELLRRSHHADRCDRPRQESAASADIVVHYNPTAGGANFAGYAVCGDHGCPNILVRSTLPPSSNVDPYSPEYLGLVTLHEIGHALGLGHATNLLESTDLMGYGWPDLGDPVLSQCDVDALAFVFAWALEGSEPHEPAVGPFEC